MGSRTGRISTEKLLEILKSDVEYFYLFERGAAVSSKFSSLVEVDLKSAMQYTVKYFFPDIYKQIEDCYLNTELYSDKKSKHQCAVKRIKYEVFNNDEKSFYKFIKYINKKYKEVLFDFVIKKYNILELIYFKKDGLLILTDCRKNNFSEYEKFFKFNIKSVNYFIKNKNDLELVVYNDTKDEIIKVKGNYKYISKLIKNILIGKISAEVFFEYSKEFKSVSKYLNVYEKIDLIQKLIGGKKENKIFEYNSSKFIDLELFNKKILNKEEYFNKYDFYKVYQKIIYPILEIKYEVF